MENTHDDTHLIDKQEQNREYAEDVKEEFFEGTSEKKITKEELENIHPGLHHQQWTQISWVFIIIIQKTSLMIQNIFANISGEF